MMNQWMQKQMTNKTYPPDSKDVLLPRMQGTECMINHRPLHINPASVLPENSCSQDTKVDTPPLLASPPMHQCQIMKITELSGLATNSYEAWSEPVGTNQQSGAEKHSQQQFAGADSV